MKNTLIAISTFKKNPALVELLDSLNKHGYMEVADILVTDDGEGEAKGSIPPGVLYTTGKNLGIAKNKNRAIKYFLENPQYNYLLLLDDDIVFRASGLIEECIDTRLQHVTGYLGQWEDGVGVVGADDRPQLSGNPFFVDFPRQGQTEDGKISFRFGSQGGMLFFSRTILEKAGYFHIPPGKYGYEHSIHSNVINRVQGYCIDWFPILENSPKFFHDNGKYANAYEAKPQENNDWWINKKREIQKGINFINRSHGVPENEEVLKI